MYILFINMTGRVICLVLALMLSCLPNNAWVFNRLRQVVHPTIEVVNNGTVLEPGDQVAAQYDFIGINFWHHGISVTGEHDRILIIDFGSNRNLKGVSRSKIGPDLIELKTVELFRKDPDNVMIRISYWPGEAFPSSTVQTKARALLENPDAFGSYDLLKNNCEHFATYIKTGIMASSQVPDLLEMIGK